MPDRDRAKVLRAFFRPIRRAERDGKSTRFWGDVELARIPARQGDKRVVLEEIADRALPAGGTWSEAELNGILSAYYAEDVASLRRHLVEFRILGRSGGTYRRATG